MLPALDLMGRALALDPNAFAALERSATPLRIALGVVFLAGLSTSLGQSVVLFAARVKPRRFAASLVLQAVIFVGVYLFWTLSIWLVARTAFGAVQPYRSALIAVGLAYAPQLFGFFVLVPHLGSLIGIVLSIWNLLAIAVATSVVFGLELPAALASSAGGWLLLQLAQRTVGWPIGRFTHWLRQAVAGTPLERLDEFLRRHDGSGGTESTGGTGGAEGGDGGVGRSDGGAPERRREER